MSDLQNTEEAHEDENYFVSMTDMMVGMLFLFIIMLMMFALNFKKGDDASERIRNCLLAVVKENAALSAEINARIASVTKTIQEPIDALELAADQRERLLTDLKNRLNAEGITQVDIDEKNNVLHLTDDAIRFDPGKFDLDSKAQDNVARVALALSPLIEKYAACEVDAPECSAHEGPALETIFIEGQPTRPAFPIQSNGTGKTGCFRPIARRRPIVRLSPMRRN
jgi:flagellar motor protein MotB